MERLGEEGFWKFGVFIRIIKEANVQQNTNIIIGVILVRLYNWSMRNVAAW